MRLVERPHQQSPWLHDGRVTVHPSAMLVFSANDVVSRPRTEVSGGNPVRQKVSGLSYTLLE